MTEGDTTYDIVIVDLSLSGAQLQCDRRFATGAVVTMTFAVPIMAHTITAKATVRWCADGGVGIQFAGLRAKDVWALGKYFETLE